MPPKNGYRPRIVSGSWLPNSRVIEACNAPLKVTCVSAPASAKQLQPQNGPWRITVRRETRNGAASESPVGGVDGVVTGVVAAGPTAASAAKAPPDISMVASSTELYQPR